MDFFKQNDEQTVPGLTPLVAENRFISKTPDTAPLPVFGEVKPLLPRPVWDGHADHIRCYWRTWELAFGNLRRPLPGTGFVSNFIDTAFNGCEFTWDSSFILMFGKYAEQNIPVSGDIGQSVFPPAPGWIHLPRDRGGDGPGPLHPP
jgi:hypothetical protein